MSKYLFNNNIHGYEKVSVGEFDVSDKVESTLVIVVDKSCDNEVGSYYKLIDEALRNKNRVILIGVNDGNKIFRPLASLMITFKCYDIYTIEDKDMLQAKELLAMEDRHPDLAEVQTYVGGDVTAFSDMSTILFGIESLVDEGHEDKLKAFLEEHLISIENFTTTLNNMKKTCDVFNSNELIDTINALKEKENRLNKALAEKDGVIEEVKHDRDKFKVAVEDVKRENEKLKNKNSDLKAQSEYGGAIIHSYKELNTQLISCKAKLVVYFKEISYVTYTNSLVTQFMDILEMKKLKAKLLIYDTQTNLYMPYKPLNVVSGSEYLSMKGTLISSKTGFVATEPNPTILQDLLTSERCFDVVVIYDRMKDPTDIVSGNNVSKFYIINSNKDYDAVKNVLKINDTSFIITQAHSKIGGKDGKQKQFLDIPYIDGYSNLTTTAKTSKYMKLYTAFTKVPLIDTLIKKSRINTLTPTK